MGLDLGIMEVKWEPRAEGVLYNFWRYLSDNFSGNELEGFGGVKTYLKTELQDMADEFKEGLFAPAEIDEWVEKLFAGDEWITLVFNW